MAQVKVINVIPHGSEREAQQRLTQLAARFRKMDPETGLPLFKNPAGVVLRVRRDHAIEVLSNCVC
jgi:hypothetical protein